MTFASGILRAEDLTMVKGSTARIEVPDGVNKTTVSNDNVLEARSADKGRAVLLVGLAEGTSGLRIQRTKGEDLNYKITVRSEPLGTNDQIAELLANVPGLEIKPIGTRVCLEGKVRTQNDLEKIKKVEAAFAGAIINLVTFDTVEVAEALTTVVQKDLKALGFDSVNVQPAGDGVVLDGVVPSDTDMTNVIERTRLRTPNVKSFLRVQQKMIETDVQFVEMSRDNGHSFGQNIFDNNIVLAPSFAAASRGLPGLNLTATATYKINTVLEARNCRTLYQEHVSGESGQKVAFKQGGTLYSPGLPPIPYGVIIQVTPTLMGNDKILSDVSIEISTPLATPGPVTTREYKTATAIISKVGETVVLSGFQQALGTTSSDKTPILGDVPLLNLLFGNKSKSKGRKEAVLLLTPRPCKASPATGPAFSGETPVILNEVRDLDPEH
jgi:Flp pilus assembly secretin CpaC